MLGWLLLFIGAGWLVYKYRRTDIDQNEEESSSGLSPFAVFSIFLVIFVTMLIVMAAILYAWIQQGGPAIKMAPYGTMVPPYHGTKGAVCSAVHTVHFYSVFISGPDFILPSLKLYKK